MAAHQRLTEQERVSSNKLKNREYNKRWRENLSPEELQEWRSRKRAYMRTYWSTDRGKEVRKANYERNRERRLAQSKKDRLLKPHYSHAHAHQARLKKLRPDLLGVSTITVDSLTEWLQEHKGKPCPYCGYPTEHIDHITPLSRGGVHEFSNLQMLCRRCNMAKGINDLASFDDWIAALVEKNIQRRELLPTFAV